MMCETVAQLAEGIEHQLGNHRMVPRLITPRTILWMSVLLVVAPSSAAGAPTEPVRDAVLVLPTRSSTLDAGATAVLDSLILSVASRAESLKVASLGDVNAVVSAERLKDVLGCDDVTCASEIGSALGVAWLLTSSAERVGTEILITLTMLDARRAEVRSRSVGRVPSDNQASWVEGLGALMAAAVDESAERLTPPRAVTLTRRHGISSVVLVDGGGWNDPDGPSYAGTDAITRLVGLEYRWQRTSQWALRARSAGGQTETWYGRRQVGAIHAGVGAAAQWVWLTAATPPPGCAEALVGPYVQATLEGLWGQTDGYGEGTLQFVGAAVEGGLHAYWLFVGVRAGAQTSLTANASNRRAGFVGVVLGLTWTFGGP
ncbi:MAG: hypothetical protein AAB426_08815 [Myxococcota bacterium]